MLPASLEGDSWNSFADISDDNGETREMSEFVPIRRINPNERRIVTGYITRLFVLEKVLFSQPFGKMTKILYICSLEAQVQGFIKAIRMIWGEHGT